MAQNTVFVRDQILPSYWANRIQDILSGLAPNLRLSIANATTIQVVAGTGDDTVGISIDGLWRFNTVTKQRAVSGSAGIKSIWVTCGPNVISSSPQPNTDNTVYSFELAVTAAGVPPTAVPGSLTNWREVGELSWDGTRVTRIRQFVGNIDWSEPQVTSLPLTPKDGDTVVWTPAIGDAPLPRWRMQFRASDNQWVFLGGGHARIATSAGPFAGLGGGFQAITQLNSLIIPRGGRWRIEGGIDFSVTAGLPARMQYVYAICDAAGAPIAGSGQELGGATMLTGFSGRGVGTREITVDLSAGSRQVIAYIAAPGHTVSGSVSNAQFMVRPVSLAVV
jgi:hypothetical protein